MHTRVSKRKINDIEDTNALAARIVAQATGQSSFPTKGKNLAAVALGQLGASKGGKARAALLSGKRKIEIAKKAAEARWNKR